MSSRPDPQPPHTAIIGLGYVGLPLLQAFSAADQPVFGPKYFGYDIDSAHVTAAQQKSLDATNDPTRLATATNFLICVPTPLTPTDHKPDLTHVKAAAKTLAEHMPDLPDGTLVVLESTTYPGTTRDVVKPILDQAAKPYQLAYSPERIDPGRDIDLTTVPKLVGGIDPESTDRATALYQTAFKHVLPVSSAEVAETAKLLENVYRAVNIALVNELKPYLLKTGIDPWEVIDAAATKPYGFQPFYPGPGLGGHCIPIDPFYLAHAVEQAGLPANFIALAGRVNHAMPDYIVRRTRDTLTGQPDGSLTGKKILILGLAYKPNVPDTRESPSLALIQKLTTAGANVDYHDPHVPEHKLPTGQTITAITWTPDTPKNYDALLIATAHEYYDWQKIADHAPNTTLIIDTRGVTRNLQNPTARIIQA